MITFKEYLIEYDIDHEVTGKRDVSQNGDDELVLWVLNDEYLYDAARSARSFEDLMSEIDNEFNYNNDQYNALARAFRMGELGEEAQEDEMEEQKHMADFDRSKRFNDEVSSLGDKDYKDILQSQPNNKRMKQKFGRNNRRTWGRK